MAVVEIVWAYDTDINAPEPGPRRTSHPLFFARLPDLIEADGVTAEELYARGWRLLAVLPRWEGRVYGTSIWERPDD